MLRVAKCSSVSVSSFSPSSNYTIKIIFYFIEHQHTRQRRKLRNPKMLLRRHNLSRNVIIIRLLVEHLLAIAFAFSRRIFIMFIVGCLVLRSERHLNSNSKNNKHKNLILIESISTLNALFSIYKSCIRVTRCFFFERNLGEVKNNWT